METHCRPSSTLGQSILRSDWMGWVGGLGHEFVWTPLLISMRWHLRDLFDIYIKKKKKRKKKGLQNPCLTSFTFSQTKYQNQPLFPSLTLLFPIFLLPSGLCYIFSLPQNRLDLLQPKVNGKILATVELSATKEYWISFIVSCCQNSLSPPSLYSKTPLSLWKNSTLHIGRNLNFSRNYLELTRMV